MNNQFSGPNAWGDYLTALEQATPVIEAIAVTDYYVTDTYEEVLRHKAAGRLPSTKLVFPNVELGSTLRRRKAASSISTSSSARRIRNISTSCGACYRACSSTSCRIVSIARGPISGSQESRSQHYGRAGRAGLWGQPVQGQFPEAPRSVLRKWMGEDEHPDRGGRRRGGRYVGVREAADRRSGARSRASPM